MQHFIFRILVFFVIVQFSESCSTIKQINQAKAGISSLKYLGEYEIPNNFNYKNTTVGGLSGIDYDAGNDLYYLVSDDRSEKNPARFYTAQIFLTAKGIDSLIFTDVKYMLQPDGSVYPGNKEDRFKVPDPEAIRYNPKGNYLVWSSEGERIINAKDTVLIDPSVMKISPTGAFIDSFILPENMHMSILEKGPRRNGVFEGMCFANNFKTLYVNVEEPLYDDGPRLDVMEQNTFIRIIKYDVNTKKSVAQYAYKPEPVAYAPVPESGFKINGVPDILNLDANKLLVIERSFSTGRLQNTIRLFIADLNGASDISSVKLKGNRSFTPVTKSQLLNMDDLGIYIDNIEGVTFGPLLPNGHKTLLFIADNNFSILEKTQVLLFEVIE